MSLDSTLKRKEILYDYDYIVVGSGFGGSVSALRLSQKGYKVAVLESGKRWNSSEFPKTNWNLRKFLWFPKLFCFGIQRINFLNDVMVLSGAGVGGGSLVYANTLYIPPEPFWKKEIVQKMGGKKESFLSTNLRRGCWALWKIRRLGNQIGICRKPQKLSELRIRLTKLR
ncbi:NAD(P)-binding Rossmann-like domain protein [Leptospira weilii str. Ecochallenge]|uniref:NAD(P)-binding Rossmann-like domain protein n=1 Tax=Leptospira weilii str. Ecochallenge TaxID=1049986 RepID=N1U6R5_9LEPT|nr:NAD(P)-binding Rossmann-like domain protein [Leptospira weilii str. Ecochallenge]